MEEYEKMGHLIGKLGIDVLVTKGFIAKEFVHPAIEGGVKPENIYHLSELDEMKEFFDSFLKPNDIVYFKTGGNDVDIIEYLSD